MDDEKILYAAMPNELKIPALPSKTEVRLIDHPAKGRDDFLKYMVDRPDRFLYPKVLRSDSATVQSIPAIEIASLLLHYCAKNRLYSRTRNNCQTYVTLTHILLYSLPYNILPFSGISFAADFFTLLTNAKSAKPFIPVRFFYRRRLHQ